MLALCLLGGTASPVSARELRVVGTSFLRIYEPGATAEAPPSGLGVDLLSEAARRLGLTLRFEFYPWPRAQAMVERSQADVLVGPYRTPERESRFAFTQQAFYEDALVFYARRDQQAPLWQGNFAALQGRAIAQVHGWAYGEAFERAAAQLHAGTVRDVATGLQMLRLGRIDLLASNERNTEPVLQQLRLSGTLQVSGPPLGQLRGHFACPLTTQGRRDCAALDQALGALRAQGRLRELGRRWKVGTPD